MLKLRIRSAIIGLACTLSIGSCSSEDPSPLTGEGIFTTPSGNAIIEGELFLPDGPGPFPVLIDVPGSGTLPRITGDNPLVELINGVGIAVYAYDKRGIGGSTGSYPLETPSTTTEFLSARAEDVLGIIDLLKTHAQINLDKIGLWGNSQGAWVNSIVHSQSPDVSFVIMSSCGVAAIGLSNFYDELTDDPNVTAEEATDLLTNFDGIAGFDPIDIVRSMSIPVLWMFGDEDRSHPARYDVEILEELDKSNFTIHLYQNANHDLVDLDTGELTDGLIPALLSWLNEVS